jgi:AraC-like DNA-binding protein
LIRHVIGHADSEAVISKTIHGYASRKHVCASTLVGVDALAALLDGPRARGAFLLRCLMEPPWSIRVRDEAPLCLTAITRGHAWVLPDDGDPVLARTGDIVINRGPKPYTVADQPNTPPQVVIHPGQRCTTPDGVELTQAMELGTRTWGNSADGGTVMLVGTYQLDGEIGARLLRALPPVMLLRERDWDSPLVPLLAKEIVRDDPGQEAVLDRLLDLLLISVLRAWFDCPEAAAPGWYRAHADPVVGRALRLLHHNPAHPWTVAELASTTGVSRAALARRFTELVGEPPMSYLTGWRLALAADLLRERDATIASVARRVGYSGPFALSVAFKRVWAVSPKDYRARSLVTDRRRSTHAVDIASQSE